MIGGEDVREFSTLEVAVALNGLKTSGVSVAIFDDVEVLADNWGPICGIGGGVGSVGMALLTASCKVKLNKTLIKQLKYSKKIPSNSNWLLPVVRWPLLNPRCQCKPTKNQKKSS